MLKFFKKNISKEFYKFVLGAIINTLLSNLILFILLHITYVSLATLISDIFYSFNSYFINSRKVFKIRGKFKNFLILIICSWFLKWQIVEFLFFLNIKKYHIVIIIIPIFGIGSYLIQKKLVFKSKNSL